MTVYRADVHLQRSVLATPGSNPRMIARALASDADVVMIDLEDAVAPDAKTAARPTVADALREGDWRDRPRTFRMNALDTPWFVRDLVEVIEGARGQVDRIVVPKVGSPEDVYTVVTILASLEVAAGAQHPIALETQIESAAGLARCEAIATASPRVKALVFGPGDYAASVQMPLAAIGMPDRWDAEYPGHRWDYPLQRVLVAATEEDVGFDRRVTGDGVAWLLGLTRTLCPVLLQGEVAETWTGLRPGSETGDPLIGPVPGYQGLWVSAGHFRTGAKEAPATAMLVAEALATGETPPLLAAFAPAAQVIDA